ncbi:hypothetical protein KIN20_036847 [Parelaphostrongylus tenuis]|uniref:Uncharacterized protein n=1 Tax=Parelaphostrongylus tenuis TaxID=148309 RepID=A0AAD5RDE5_PARTN|nr:hypothetical protein KIN20_036847 [Parelaphostrongylus tenuis]
MQRFFNQLTPLSVGIPSVNERGVRQNTHVAVEQARICIDDYYKTNELMGKMLNNDNIGGHHIFYQLIWRGLLKWSAIFDKVLLNCFLLRRSALAFCFAAVELRNRSTGADYPPSIISLLHRQGRERDILFIDADNGHSRSSRKLNAD